MMTGEPLFPGESDVDQLFQIVRILGKVNARHQLLITRNTMFKGMKQEHNCSLAQLFPDWNRDSLQFLNQCLKMDGAARPDTTKLLKHDLFTRDDFVDTFLPELRSKLHQELQGNPLLKRLQSMAHPQRKTEERKSSNGTIVVPNERLNHTKPTKGQIGLSLTQILNQNHHPDKTSMAKFPEPSSIRSSQGSDELNFNLANYKHYLTSQHNKSLLSNNSKSIHINNLTLTGGASSNLKYGARILSAKHHKPASTLSGEKTNANSTTTGDNIHIQPPSPVQFQSLQHESVTTSQFANLMDVRNSARHSSAHHQIDSTLILAETFSAELASHHQQLDVKWQQHSFLLCQQEKHKPVEPQFSSSANQPGHNELQSDGIHEIQSAAPRYANGSPKAGKGSATRRWTLALRSDHDAFRERFC